MKRTLRRFLGVISVMSALALAITTPKNVAYLQNIDDTITTADALSTLIRVKPEDKISIVVHSKDDQLSKLFNLPVVSTNITQATDHHRGHHHPQRRRRKVRYAGLHSQP